MAQWIKFLFIPILVISVLGIFASIMYGSALSAQIYWSFWRIVKFISHFIGGAEMLRYAPNNRTELAYLFAFLYSCSSFYLAIELDGVIFYVMGEIIFMEFSWAEELTKTVGVFLGIICNVQSKDGK